MRIVSRTKFVQTQAPINMKHNLPKLILALVFLIGILLLVSSNQQEAIAETSIVNAPPGYAVFGRLPWDTSKQSSVRVSRTGRLYEPTYKAAGLTGYQSDDYHGDNSATGLKAAQRAAIDFMLPANTPVVSVASGTVHKFISCGIYIKHSNDVISFYLHLNAREPSLKVGDPVKEGQVIGKSGDCGSAGSPHLHFAVVKNNERDEVRVAFSNVPAQSSNGKTCPASIICPSRTNYVEFRYGANAKPTSIRVKATYQGRTTSNLDIWVYNSAKKRVWTGTRTGVPTNTLSPTINIGPLPTGTYWVLVRTPKHSLFKAKKVELLNGKTTDIDFGQLLGGDYNGDDRINIVDFGAKTIGFSKNYNQGDKKDMNLGGPDLKLTIHDFQIFAFNYGKQGGLLSNKLPRKSLVALATGSDSRISDQDGATGFSIDLNPTFASYAVGQEFEIDVSLIGDALTSSGTDIVLQYDSCSLEVVSFTGGTVYTEQLEDSPDPELGLVNVSLSEEVGGEATANKGLLGKVKFRVTRSTPETIIRVMHTPGDTTDSNVVDYSSDDDLLVAGTRSEALYTLTGSPSRPAVSGTLSPTSGTFLIEPVVPIAVEVNDGCGHSIADTVRFDAFYDGKWYVLGFDRNGGDGWAMDWEPGGIADQVISIRATIFGISGSPTSVIADNLMLDRQAPSKPSVIAPVEMSAAGTVELQWQAQDNLSGIEFYNVSEQVVSSGVWNDPIIGITQTTTQIAELASGEDYAYQVQAIDHSGNSSEGSDPIVVTGRYEPDNSSNQAKTITSGETQYRSLYTTGDTDWIKFTLTQESAISIETDGNDGDTQLRLYNSAVNEIADDDDGGNGAFSRIDLQCGVGALPAGTYYISVNEKGNNDELWSYSLTYSVVQTCPQQPTATATASPNPTATATPTIGPSPTATATATLGPSPTATATATPGPSLTPTATSTAIPNLTATATATLIHNLTPTATPTQAVSPTPPTATPTATRPPNLDWQTYLPIAIGGDVGRR